MGAISHGVDLRRRGDGLEARSAAAAAGRPGRRKRGTEAPGRAAVRAKTDRSTPAWDVAEVVGRAADGDQLAWERLFDQYARLI